MAGSLSEAMGQQGAVTPGLAQAAASAGAPGPQQSQPQAAQQPQQASPSPAPTEAGSAPQAAPEAGQQPQVDPSMMAGNEEMATPDEQQEYERVMGAVAKVLYENDNTANAITQQVDPEDPVGSATRANILFIRELDQKVNMGEAVVAEVTREVTERIMELAESRHGFEYTPQQAQQVLGATWEGVVALFGADGGPEAEADFKEWLGGLDDQTMASAKQNYEAALNG